MKAGHDGTHLTLEERKIIQAGIENGAANYLRFCITTAKATSAAS